MVNAQVGFGLPVMAIAGGRAGVTRDTAGLTYRHLNKVGHRMGRTSMWDPDLRLLVEQWQDAARAQPDLATAFERCATELTRAIEGDQPSHLVTVGVLDGIGHRIVIVWDPQGHGRYGVWSFPTIPGQGKYLVMLVADRSSRPIGS
jgi:hypothetical protein